MQLHSVVLDLLVISGSPTIIRGINVFQKSLDKSEMAKWPKGATHVIFFYTEL
jgi:hypothetical protein